MGEKDLKRNICKITGHKYSQVKKREDRCKRCDGLNVEEAVMYYVSFLFMGQKNVLAVQKEMAISIRGYLDLLKIHGDIIDYRNVSVSHYIILEYIPIGESAYVKICQQLF